MAKAKRVYTCDACGSRQAQWQGQCPDCGGWNTLSESVSVPERSRRSQFAGSIEFSRLDAITVDQLERMPTGLAEFDRVLGGGLVPGSVVLIGGDPGIGKSTLLLKVLATLAERHAACYDR